MFVVILTYQKPLSEVDAHLAAHRGFLETCYQKNQLIASGPQNPRTGGIFISQLKNRSEMDVLIAQDPFHKQGIASYQVIEFDPVKSHPDFKAFLS